MSNSYEIKCNADMSCKCDTNCKCNSTMGKWCDTIVYQIYRGDDLKTLPNSILIQMIHSLEDKINNK